MEGRCLWVQDSDVDGPLDEGCVVTATRPLADFCLRGDDGSSPVAAGSLLEIVETRPWGAAMAQELSDAHVDGETVIDERPAIYAAMVELEQLGLWEFTPAAAARSCVRCGSDPAPVAARVAHE